MSIKQLLTKTILVAAALCIGASAWATSSTNTAGQEGNGQQWNTGDDWYTKDYVLKGNGTYNFTFTTTNATSQNYYGWSLFVSKNGCADMWAQNFMICRSGIGDAWGSAFTGTITSSNTYATENPSGAGIVSAMNGATVNVSVTRNSTDITVVSEVTPTSENPFTITNTYTYADADDKGCDVYLNFAVDNAYVSVSKARQASATFDFQTGKIPFVVGSSGIDGVTNRLSTPSIVDDATLSSKVVKFVRSNNSTGFAWACYDFSDLMTNASSVNIAFDFYVTQGAGHNVISLADADHHTSNAGWSYAGNTGYTSTGTVFNVGCFRSGSGKTATNYFGVNGVQNTTLGATGLNAWYHASINVDLTSKKVNYTITYIDDDPETDVLVSGSNVSFLNGSAQTCSQIDVFLGSVSNATPTYIDNLVITPTVNESTHSYVINAVTSTGTTITSLASGMCDEDEDYAAIAPKVVSDGEHYYVLDDTDPDLSTGYEASFTMGGSDETKEITYTLDDEIIFYYEGGDLGDNANYSYGNVGSISSQNYRCRGISVGALSAGQYEIESYLTGNASWQICLRDKYIASGTESANIVCSLTGDLNKKLTETFSLENALATSCLNGNNLPGAGTNGTYASATFDYIIIRKTSNLPATVSATVGATGFATYSNANYALDFTGLSVKAYKATLTGENTVLLSPVTTVPANTGLLLKGAANTYNVPVIASASAIVGNLLKPSADADIPASVDGTNHYVLANGTNGVGFYNLDAAKNIGAGKAYLETTTALATGSTARVSIVFEDEETTGISATLNDNVGMENDKAFYNLQGQRVAQPRKGLYIMNGKKVIVK